VNEIGQNGPANHQYDINDWYAAIDAGKLPSVSFLKAPSYQDAHPGNSNPLDEQWFIVHVVNYLQQHNAWANTAVVLAYDDSDGWYDHVVPPIVNGSGTPSDTLNGVNLYGTGVPHWLGRAPRRLTAAAATACDCPCKLSRRGQNTTTWIIR
jgi:phospholipase C